VAAAEPGPMLWASGSRGWQLGTPARSPDPNELAPALQRQGLVQAPLQLQGQTVQVWTRLAAAAQGAVAGTLEATVVGAHTGASAGPSWWAQTLPALAQVLEPPTSDRPQVNPTQVALEQLAAPRALLRWALAPAPARQLLQRWQPWQLLSGVAAAPLADAVQGLSLSLEAQDSQLQLKAQLRFA